jgi:NTE family protein
VLSGGGNLGALQVGMLRALLEHDVAADLVLGCSVGAINGAGFADDPTLEGIGRLERLWKSVDGLDLLPSGWLPNAVALARKGEAVHDNSGLRRMAEDSLGVTDFEQLRVPFQCVATDIIGVREVWFSSGPIVDAILASSALPAIYPAVEIDGVRYLDGGIVDDVPMSRAVELGATRIYVLQVGGFTRPRPEPRRPLDVAVQAYWIARHHRFKHELASMPPGVEVHVLPAGETPRMRFNDFAQSGTLMALAHRATSAYLDDRAAGLPIPPIDEALTAPATVGDTGPVPVVPASSSAAIDPVDGLDALAAAGELAALGLDALDDDLDGIDTAEAGRAEAGRAGAGPADTAAGGAATTAGAPDASDHPDAAEPARARASRLRDRARARALGSGGTGPDTDPADPDRDHDHHHELHGDGHGVPGYGLAVSGLGAAQALGARVAKLPRVAKLLSRGDTG